ncbi:hypothetical protein DID80_04475 [Candidatus Marinamargulisbacteria bacterium SCGC AAA071-K20]|nr:hypothetical protein DID80_04475 [Candidatus Marinamargulisbacteria bacterium SCGC AAA071-K20]
MSQETYYQAFRYLSDTSRKIDNIEPYLYQVARREVIRVNKQERKETEKWDVENVYSSLLSQEELESIEDRIGKLPTSYGAVVSIVLDGFNLAEAAQLLNLKLGTIKSRLFRAKKLLRLGRAEL